MPPGARRAAAVWAGKLEVCPTRLASRAGAPVRPWVRSQEFGFTLVEVLVALAIVLTLAAIAIPNLMAAMDHAKNAKAIADIHTLGTAAIGYDVVYQQYPNTLTDIGYGDLLDPWGNPYQYLNFANTKGKGAMRKDRFLVPINTYFDLYSMGKDGSSVAPLTAPVSHDDVIWANDGAFIGMASDY